MKLKPEKNSGLQNGIRTHDLCDTGAIKPTGNWLLCELVRKWTMSRTIFIVQTSVSRLKLERKIKLKSAILLSLENLIRETD